MSSCFTLYVMSLSIGLWKISLPPCSASFEAISLTFINSAMEKVHLEDILFGDVFLCSGQSNMEYSINYVKDSEAAVAEVDSYPGIRIMSGTTEHGGDLSK